MNLSPHFTLGEACKSHVASRCGIDNKPPQFVVTNLKRVAEEILEPVRAHYGIPFTPNSWYRCSELNKMVGSKPSSDHITGNAVDFELPGVSNIDLARWCAHNLTFDQLLLEFHDPEDPASGWVHCSISDEPRGEILTITKDGVTKGLPE